MLTLRTTTISAGEASSTTRQNRRAYVSPDLLRTHKLPAGEWVSVTNSESSATSGSVVVQLWPRSGLEDDGEF